MSSHDGLGLGATEFVLSTHALDKLPTVGTLRIKDFLAMREVLEGSQTPTDRYAVIHPTWLKPSTWDPKTRRRLAWHRAHQVPRKRFVNGRRRKR